MCCTFFASFGALFLFLISGLMRSNYRYMHVEGDIEAMKDPVSYAGAREFSCAPPRRPPGQPALPRPPPPPPCFAAFFYLIIALISMCCWAKGNGKRQEWEESEMETAALISGEGGSEGGQKD